MQAHLPHQGLKALKAGAITFCVMSRCSSNEPRRLLAASIAAPFPRTGKPTAISVNTTPSARRRNSGDYAEDLAAAMLASTWASISMWTKAGTKRRNCSASRQDRGDRNITQSSIVKDTVIQRFWPPRFSSSRVEAMKKEVDLIERLCAFLEECPPGGFWTTAGIPSFGETWKGPMPGPA